MLKVDSLLRALRNSAGLTQSELASRAGIGQGYLSEIETVGSEKSPSAETLIALAKALGVEPDWLLALKGSSRFTPSRPVDVTPLPGSVRGAGPGKAVSGARRSDRHPTGR
jgi:transcriptional regulator with XRE-family HTH domain